MGTPMFSVQILKSLYQNGFPVTTVYCQPPQKSNRGQKITTSPVQNIAEIFNLEVRTPEKLKNNKEEYEFLKNLDADIAVTCAYGQLIPKEFLELTKKGFINIHASLLPRWRGSAPIQRAILAGDKITGVTIMGMEKDLDAGPVYLKREVPISEKTTTQSLHDALAGLGGAMMIKVLKQIVKGTLLPKPQAEEGVTYANKLKKSEGRIDWTRESAQIECQIRGLNPWPGVWFEFDGDRIKVLSAHIGPDEGLAGTVVKGPLNIACGKGSICIDRVQRSGRDPMDVQDFVRGSSIAVGTLLI